jgi:hypothetical protein
MKRYKPKENQWNKIPFNKRTDIINNLFKPIKNEKTIKQDEEHIKEFEDSFKSDS